MKLVRLTERLWYYPYEFDRDRPNLGYIKGDNWSLAVDAGHSASHTEEFYKALEEEGLPLPSLTVLTHWHCDHTFGMHAVNGLCIANSKTNQHLIEYRDRIAKEGPEWFIKSHETIEKDKGLCESLVKTLSYIDVDRFLEGHWTPDTLQGIVDDW